MTVTVRSASLHIDALRYVHAVTVEQGFPPTIREIGRAVGYSSSSSAATIVNSLVRKGWIETAPRRTRTMRLTDAGMAVIGVTA